MRKPSFRHRPPTGKPQTGRRSPRQEDEGKKSGREEQASPARASTRSGKRAALNKKRSAGKERPKSADERTGPPPGVRVRSRKAPSGSRYDRMDRPEWRAAREASEARSGARRSGAREARAERPSVTEPMRIAKAMARAGLCSRREAERWIADGRVSVNGEVLKTPAIEVKPSDRVLVDGRPLPVAEPAQLWRYNKPKGMVTTHNDPQGRPTVFDNLPPALPRVISVGRLDFNTEGLILLTNDGELARHLELPTTGWMRRYRVRAKGRVTQTDLDKLIEGVEIEGVRYGPVEAAIDSAQGANMWLSVGIREGKNREVRKLLAYLGLEVNRLIRVSFGPFQLLELKPGEAEPVKRRTLAGELGSKLAATFGLIDDAEEKPRKAAGRPPRGGKRKDPREAK